MWVLVSSFFKGTEQATGMTDGGWLDLARSSFSDGGRQWRAQIQELEEAGHGPGRCATADGYF